MNKRNLSKVIVIGSVFILCIIFTAGGQTSLFSTNRMIGDVNSDNSVNIVDALAIAQFYVNGSKGDVYLPFGDPSNDDTIDIVDALMAAQYYVGLITEFPRKSPLDAVAAWAKTNNIDLTGYNTGLFGTKEMAAILPGYSFVAIIQIQYPVAYGHLEPALGTNSIAAVDKNLNVQIINDTKALIAFFQAHGIPAFDNQKILLTVKAWLGISQELKNDGFYTFTIPDSRVQILPVGSIQAQGVSEVTGGGSGAITANIWFGTPDYLVYHVVEQVSLVMGIRPVCQSTKLLDKDPVVRKMAEQALLAMGTSCFDYLFTQRTKASPQLKAAIDAMVQKIMVQDEQLRKIQTVLGK